WCLALHRNLSHETVAVSRDRRHGKRPPRTRVSHRAVARFERAVDPNRVPLRGMADVVDGDVVMLAPEERNRVEALAPAHDVPRGNLPLTFGDPPVLDAYPLAGPGIRPARDVSCREDTRRARLEEFVHEDAAIEREAGFLGERRRRLHADAHHDEVRV